MNIEKIKVKARFFKAIAFFIFFLICVSAALLISPFTPEEKHQVNSQKTTELLPVKPAQNSPVYKSEKSQNFYNPENDIKQDIDIQPDNNSYILLFSSDKAGISSTDETGSGTGQKENFGVADVSETGQEEAAGQPQNFSDFAFQVLQFINTVRSEKGLSPLNLDTVLCEIATSRCIDMLERNYFSHNTPDGKNIFLILQERGIGYAVSGENIQQSYPADNVSAQQYFDTWMQSTPHRDNILSGNFTQIGIGFISGDGWFISTLVFLG